MVEIVLTSLEAPIFNKAAVVPSRWLITRAERSKSDGISHGDDKPSASRLRFSALTGTKRRGAAAVAAHVMGVGPTTSSSSRSGSEALLSNRLNSKNRIQGGRI